MPSNSYFSFLYKMLEKHLWNSFLLYLVVEILQLVHEISTFPEVIYKRGVLKNFLKFTDKHKEQSSEGALSKDVLKNFLKFTERHLFRSLFFNKVADWKPETVRRSHWRCSVKQVVLKNFANFTRENLYWSLLSIKLQFWGPATISKKRRKVFSCKLYKLLRAIILKNIYERLLLNLRPLVILKFGHC